MAKARTQRHVITVPGEDVKAIRHALGWTQREMAGALGISSPHLEDLEAYGAHEMQRLALIGLVMAKRPALMTFSDFAFCVHKLDSPQLSLNAASPPELLAS